ncbi:MAG: MBL fold metallo-hydrolase, partial [Planctomycetes bacterium]|nr:MBL fold metallo-hydrolase [Planctomycetota bacterium]
MQDRTVTRRRFLRRVGLGSAGLAGVSLGGSLIGLPASALGQTGDDTAPGGFTRLTEHLSVFHGPINIGVLRHADRALLIDCGDGRVADALKKTGVTAVERILFTHHHRDQACGAGRLIAAGTQIGVPNAER